MAGSFQQELTRRFSFRHRLDIDRSDTRAVKAAAAANGVWLARCKETGANRVVKVGERQRGAFADLLTRLRDLGEAGAIERSLLPVYDFAWEASSSRHFSVYKFLPTGTLREVMNRGRPASELLDAKATRRPTAHDHREREIAARRALEDLSAALHWLHEGNGHQVFIHGDVKPSNILVDEIGGARRFLLGDFDAVVEKPAARRGANPQPTSAGYGPPERFDRGYYPRSDYWQLGMVIGEMLMGRHPLEAEERRDAADLPDGWLPGSPEFKELGEPWQALLYGLLALRPGDRWEGAHVAEWLSANERRRHDAIAMGLRLGNVLTADRPFVINGKAIHTVHSAAEELLRSRSAEVATDPCPLADWVEKLGLSGTAEDIRRTMATADPHVRTVAIALTLDPKQVPTWRTVPISPEAIVHHARFDSDPRRADWLATLRSSGVLELCAEAARPDVASIAQAVGESLERLQAAWARAQATGCRCAEPDEDGLWRSACLIAFDPKLRAHARDAVRRITASSELYLRPRWLAAFGSDADKLTVEEALVLSEIVGRRLPGEPEADARFTDVIDDGAGSDEELAERPIIRLRSHARLLATIAVLPSPPPVTLTGGEYFPAEYHATFLFAARRWLRQVVYSMLRARLGRDPIDRMRRAAPIGSPYRDPPQLVVGATVFSVAGKVPELHEGPPGKAALVYWHAPEGFSARLELKAPGLLRDRLLWRTPILPRSGQMLLALPRSTLITLVSNPGLRMWGRPKFHSDEIVVNIPHPDLDHRAVEPSSAPKLRFEPQLERLAQPEFTPGAGVAPLRFLSAHGRPGNLPGSDAGDDHSGHRFAIARGELPPCRPLSRPRRQLYRFVERTTVQGSATYE